MTWKVGDLVIPNNSREPNVNAFVFRILDLLPKERMYLHRSPCAGELENISGQLPGEIVIETKFLVPAEAPGWEIIPAEDALEIQDGCQIYEGSDGWRLVEGVRDNYWYLPARRPIP